MALCLQTDELVLMTLLVHSTYYVVSGSMMRNLQIAILQAWKITNYIF